MRLEQCLYSLTSDYFTGCRSFKNVAGWTTWCLSIYITVHCVDCRQARNTGIDLQLLFICNSCGVALLCLLQVYIMKYLWTYSSNSYPYWSWRCLQTFEERQNMGMKLNKCKTAKKLLSFKVRFKTRQQELCIRCKSETNCSSYESTKVSRNSETLNLI